MRDRYDRGYLEGSTVFDISVLGASFSDTTTTTVTVPGARLGDYCVAAFDSDISACSLDAGVSAAGTVTVKIMRAWDATIELVSPTIRVRVYPY